MGEVVELSWRLICPGCGRMENVWVRIHARLDFGCPEEGCSRHLSDYVREAV